VVGFLGPVLAVGGVGGRAVAREGDAMRQAILRRAVELEICQCCGAELFAADAEGSDSVTGVVEYDREMLQREGRVMVDFDLERSGDEAYNLQVALALFAGNEARKLKRRG